MAVPHRMGYDYNYTNNPLDAAVTHGSVFNKIGLKALPEWETVIEDPATVDNSLRSPFRVLNISQL